MTTTAILTRKEYMNAPTPESHRAYYAQFVSAGTVRYVVRTIGAGALMKSTDPHLNDIPLSRWDDLARGMPLARTFSSTGDFCTLAGLVCVAKEAARQYIESRKA